MTQTINNTDTSNKNNKVGDYVLGALAACLGLTYSYWAGCQSMKYQEAMTAIKTLDSIAYEIKSERNINLENIEAMKHYLTNVTISPDISLAVKKYNEAKNIPTATDAITVIENTKTSLAQTPKGTSDKIWGLGWTALGLLLFYSKPHAREKK